MRARLYVAAVLGGVAAIAVLAFLLLEPGRLDPSPPSLEARPVPEIPGEVLYVDPDGCVVRARASGERQEQVVCPEAEVTGVSWLDAETIAYAEVAAGPVYSVRLNLRTGETATGPWAGHRPAPEPVSIHNERVSFDEEGSVYVVRDATYTRVFDFEGPEYARPSFITWSPDGEWLLLWYRDELSIVGRDGRVAGTLARTGAGKASVSWWIDGYGYLPELVQDGPPPPQAPRPGATAPTPGP